MLFPTHTSSLDLPLEYWAETPHCFWLLHPTVSDWYTCVSVQSFLSDFQITSSPRWGVSFCWESVNLWYSGVLTWEQTQTNLSSLIQRECRKKKNSAQITSTSLLWNVLLHCRANTWHGTDNGSHYPLLLRFFSNTMSIAEEKSIHVAAFCSDSLSVSGKSLLFYLCPWWACRAHWEEADTQSTKCQHRSSLLCPISCTGRDICQLGAVVRWHWGISSSFQKQEI